MGVGVSCYLIVVLICNYLMTSGDNTLLIFYFYILSGEISAQIFFPFKILGCFIMLEF